MSWANSLCLACSSSLPPRRASSSSSHEHDIFVTACCNRPICPSCLASNPRLARYNPCLQCLAVADVMGARHLSNESAIVRTEGKVNVDGGIHDDDVFALGDDEDEEEDDEALPQSHEPSSDGDVSPPSPSPPQYSAAQGETHENTQSLQGSTANEDSCLPPETPTPSKHYIKPGDTLIGIALKYKVDGRLLCRLNNLPPNTLRTTPHLLHTRTVLTLPPSAVIPKTPSSPDHDQDYEARRARERAEKRFQTVTKEVDWRVAKAYVALADPEIAAADVAKEWKEADDKKRQPQWQTRICDDSGAGGSGIEAVAVDNYLDDEEWERQEREQGRGVSIPRFPLFERNSPAVEGKNPSGTKSWSGWKRK